MHSLLRYVTWACSGFYSLILASALGCGGEAGSEQVDRAAPRALGSTDTTPNEDCVQNSLRYLRETMDRYHGQRFWVYDDTDSAGNHFLVWASFTSGNEVSCPIIIHGDTRDAVFGGSTSCSVSTDPAAKVDWRRYDPPANGNATFSLCGSLFDTVLSIHEPCPGRAEIACNDDACAQQSALTLPVDQGQSYLIRIAGKGADAGPYTLRIEGPPAPDAQATQNCGVSVEFNAFRTRIYDGAIASPIRSGATAIEFRLNYTDLLDYGGLVMNHGRFPPIADGGVLGPNHGTDPDARTNLSGATALRFYARGEKGGEIVDFFVGGVGWDGDTPVERYPDSTPAIKQRVVLTSDWQAYTIPLAGADLSGVIGGFGWAANADGDPDRGNPGSDQAIIFYVDEIYFELTQGVAEQRQSGPPRFLQSFTTRPIQNVWDPVVEDFDHRFRSVALVYDNALALLAFLADGAAEGLAQARLIGDAFVYAAGHDRAFADGRLRSAYSAGDLALPPGWIPNDLVGEVRLAGFFNPQCQEWQTLFADNISTGNTAWAMLALLALYERTLEPPYLEEARKLGDFIRGFRDDTCEDEQGRKVGGFTGGLYDIEAPEPKREAFSSAEHNIDVYAAFTLMYRITREAQWLDGAEHARRFVWSLWNPDTGCFSAGRECIGPTPGPGCGPDDTCRINTRTGELPLDVQAWSVLGIPDTFCVISRDVLECAENNHLLQSDGFTGFDFNDDRDGIWFEGTAHMATAYAFALQHPQAQTYRDELCRAQAELPEPILRSELPSPFDGRIGLVAGSHDGITTGFGFLIHQRLHIGATAWNVFAQLGFNPFTQVTWSDADFDCDDVRNADDDCPASDLSGTIAIDGCDTGVANSALGNGCTMADEIAKAAAAASNHGNFVSRVAYLTSRWVRQGLLSGAEKGRIARCAARAR